MSGYKETNFLTLIIILFLTLITFGLFGLFYSIYKNRQARNYVNELQNNQTKYTYDEFCLMYENIKKSGLRLSDAKTSGVYIIYNESYDKYYVGQSKDVLKRVKNHFTGKGNGDIYADLKFGSNFSLSIIPCPEEELDIVEKQCINKYNAYKQGYNKNRGNGLGW